ncbi:MAG: SpoIIE family protein phosphatase [Prochlorothrix sp.]
MKLLQVKQALGGAVVTTVAVLLTTSFIVETDYRRFQEAERATILQQISTLRAKLEAIVNSRLLIVEGLVAYVATHPDTDQAEFSAMAETILRKQPGIRSTNLAKDSRISHIYPFVGNEKALGLNVLGVPEQRAALERAIRERRSIVAGPTQLVQGGLAFINRIPIYALGQPPLSEASPDRSAPISKPDRVDSAPVADYYWGFASILVDADQLYQDSGLLDLTERLQVSLRGKDALGEQGAVFFGSEEIFETDPVTLMVTLPNGSWQIAAMPREGWSQHSPLFWWLWGAGLLMAGVSGSFVFVLISEPSRLQAAVDQGTHDLALTLEQLRREMADRQQAEAELLESRRQLAMQEAELAITHDLQQMLLPPAMFLSHIPDLEVRGFMEPAEEVGGDYYDVMYLHDRIYIAIGDVTGHGLESGMVMLMVQAALRSLLESNTASMMEQLSALNRMICANTHRMGSPKQMTLTLLEYRSGQIFLCGQHEDVLILRHDQRLEVIDTFNYGFPLGLESDITPFMQTLVLELHPQDTVLLYTDGITEAMNEQKQIYGRDRLCQVFQDCWGQPLARIQATLIEDVHRHLGDQPVADDLTLVLFRRQWDPSSGSSPEPVV